MEPGSKIGVGNGFIDFMGNDIRHAVGTLVSIGTNALVLAPVRALRRGISDAPILDIGPAHSLAGVIATIRATEVALRYIRSSQHQIDSIAVDREFPRVQSRGNHCRHGTTAQ